MTPKELYEMTGSFPTKFTLECGAMYETETIKNPDGSYSVLVWCMDGVKKSELVSLEHGDTLDEAIKDTIENCF